MIGGIESPAHAWVQVGVTLAVPIITGLWWAYKNGDDGMGVPDAKWWHDRSGHAATIDPGIALAQRDLMSPE